jgi:hypothetical protein
VIVSVHWLTVSVIVTDPNPPSSIVTVTVDVGAVGLPIPTLAFLSLNPRSESHLTSR